MFVDIDHMNVHIDDFHTFRTSLEILYNTGYLLNYVGYHWTDHSNLWELPQPQMPKRMKNY